MKNKNKKNLEDIMKSCSQLLQIIDASKMEETDKERCKEELAFINNKINNKK